jgi:hypothetical protein
LLGLALPIGMAFGIVLARLMGYTESFLVFTARSPLPVSWQGLNLALVALVAAASLATRLVLSCCADVTASSSRRANMPGPSARPGGSELI